MYFPTCQLSLKEIFNPTCLRKENKEVLYWYGIDYWAKFNSNELLLKKYMCIHCICHSFSVQCVLLQ